MQTSFIASLAICVTLVTTDEARQPWPQHGLLLLVLPLPTISSNYYKPCGGAGEGGCEGGGVIAPYEALARAKDGQASDRALQSIAWFFSRSRPLLIVSPSFLFQPVVCPNSLTHTHPSLKGRRQNIWTQAAAGMAPDTVVLIQRGRQQQNRSTRRGCDDVGEV